MLRFRLLILCAPMFCALVGCGPATPRSKLTGEWKGAPDVSGEVEQYVDQVKAKGGDEETQEVMRGIAEYGGKFASRMALPVELDLVSDGSAAIRGESQRVMTIPPGQKGAWEVSDKEPATLKVTFGDKVLEGKVTFRDEDAFFFTFDAPVEATTSLTEIATGPPGEGEGEEEKPKTKPATMLFRRKGAVREM